MRAYLLDDEPLAVKRLARLLEEAGRAEIVGSSSDPMAAAAWLNGNPVDVLFVDIEMPGLNGFELLARLASPPLVVFVTAFDQYALRAFQASSIDYLLKPVEPVPLARALSKLERMLGSGEAPSQNIAGLLEKLLAKYPARVASRTGDKVEFVEVAEVTHFYAKDKLTHAAVAAKHYMLDQTISDLEQRLDPVQFLRIHRGTLVKVSEIRELHSWFGGRMIVRLKDGKTELPVARERVAELKLRMGLSG